MIPQTARVDDLNARSARSDDLVSRWIGLVGDTLEAREHGTDLIGRWGEPHRRYHDLAHLRSVLDHVDALVGAEPTISSDADAVRLAAFFHDAVYDPNRPDNETSSARLAAEVLDHLGVSDPRVREVSRLVLLTATHQVSAEDGNGALLCDADLAVLASDPETYAAYAVAVREEYSHVPEPMFRAGRAKILEALLAHDVIYRSTSGRSWWEEAARRNVQAELILLNAQVDHYGATDEARPPADA